MAQVTFALNIDDSLVAEATAALCWKGGYQVQVPDPENPGQTIANPATPEDGAKQAVNGFILNAITDYKNMQALQAVTPPAGNLIS